MYQRVKYDFNQELVKIKDSGLFKEERLILSSQKPSIHVSFPAGAEPREVLNFCSNNYLGLANHPDLIQAAHRGPGPPRLRPGLGALHLRHAGPAQDAEERIAEFLPHRGHHPLFLLLRRQRRAVRKPARQPRTSSSPTRSTTPASSTASACARPSASSTSTPTWSRWRTP